jgi:hypothetical protein
MATSVQLVFAARDPGGLARFWRTALDYEPEPPPAGFTSWQEFAREKNLPLEAGRDIDSAVDPDRVGPRLLFERADDVSERGAVHIDVNAAQGHGSAAERKSRVDAKVALLESAGAATVRIVDRAEEYFVEMTDPEGNRFCVQ